MVGETGFEPATPWSRTISEWVGCTWMSLYLYGKYQKGGVDAKTDTSPYRQILPTKFTTVGCALDSARAED